MYLCVRKDPYVKEPAVAAKDAVVNEAGEEMLAAIPAKRAVMGLEVRKCHIEAKPERMAEMMAREDLNWDYYKILIDENLNPTLSKISIAGMKPKMVETPALQDAQGNAIE